MVMSYFLQISIKKCRADKEMAGYNLHQKFRPNKKKQNLSAPSISHLPVSERQLPNVTERGCCSISIQFYKSSEKGRPKMSSSKEHQVFICTDSIICSSSRCAYKLL